ncbi:hypothetical protein BYT27DRAFT_7245483 [Phlegmacium glaucopus]|nr:hypothetical protein BYT27DRAFT_7245483 [Phlegmacium glaucopus]
MNDFMDRLSRLMTPEVKAKVENAMHRDLIIQSKGLRRIPPDPKAGQCSPVPNLNDIDECDTAGLQDAVLKSFIHMKPRFPPPEVLPCANVQVEQYTACENQGKLACGACKLVSYCSKECQREHWKFHKRDCKNRMRSENWMPIWVVENRLPSFINSENSEQEFERRGKEEFATGCSLWGNTPATDVINLAYNEKDARRDFSLAFVASGDLRHVVHTINALPSNFMGNLDILVNDVTLPVICRNIVLLIILGTIPDEKNAADVALHFWYSAFIPMEYSQQLMSVLTSFMQHKSESHDSHVFPLGPHSTLSCSLPLHAKEYFLHFVSSSISVTDAQDEYDRVRNAPSRRDYRDRMYEGLRPSHRVAFQEYRRFGIVLPFGAMNAHFNVPNISLFSQNGKWLQTDYADPLEGWDLDVIVKAGKAHGANPEDIYGCLYFFLSEQLRMFTQRLRNFKINFTVFPFEACQLSKCIRQNLLADCGIPASIRFDRIEVSNILDANYVGLRGVLTHWAPLLAESSTAVIVGYFMNWVARQKDGLAAGAGNDVVRNLTNRLLDKIKVKGRMKKFRDLKSVMSMLGHMNAINALYENSKPFATFLRNEGLPGILRETNLRLREEHTIVPHRNMVPLKASRNALPEFPDDETWYYYTKLSSDSWLSRYVEFSRK